MADEYAKIEIRVRRNDSDEVDVETLWAVQVGPNCYRLDNCPFFAYGLSTDDIVEANPQDDGFPLFSRVVEKSGNRTIRVILDPPCDESEESQNVLDTLCEMGCSYEGANPAYVCINIGPELDLTAVAEYLESTGHEWEYADPTYDNLFADG